jgi:uncharacterized protein with HEPN domain
MKRDPKVYLWDAKRAVDSINKFTGGKSLAQYVTDEMLRSAVERQFEIIGEALSQLALQTSQTRSPTCHESLPFEIF